MGFITDFLATVLNFIFSLTGSYPVTILLFTLIVKLVLLPLDLKSRQSMRRTTQLQPRIDAINKKYANDATKKNQKISELYKEEHINPLSGCLPVLIQFPILIAMFTTLRHLADEQTMQMYLTVQQTGTFEPTSFLWIHNIWQPDNFLASIIPTLKNLAQMSPIDSSSIVTAENLELMRSNYEQVMGGIIAQYSSNANGWGILPVLSAASQFLATKMQQSQQPQPAAQQPASQSQGMSKMMMNIMPIMSLIFCWSYNAAFAVYWLTSNVYLLIQNLLINYYYDKKEKAPLQALQDGSKPE
jgi:YidC/Oxa1 family membrane protein insertase